MNSKESKWYKKLPTLKRTLGLMIECLPSPVLGNMFCHSDREVFELSLY